VEVKEIEKKDRKSRLLLKGIDATLLNSIRRAASKDVPVLAIENVSIYQNDSVIFDEFLAHRLGLLALKTDKTYKLGDKVKLQLDVSGPDTVYGKDIKSADPKVAVVDKNVPLVKLKKDQRVKMEMEAVMGTGAQHAKFQSAIIGFQQLPIINTSEDCNNCEDCIKACPVNVLEIKAKKVVLKNQIDCILCGKCRDVCKHKALALDFDKNAFILNVETHGNMSNAEVLSRAAKALSEKVGEFQKAVKGA
jgi:DNA-directed RNA polymerase subunit D